MSEEPLEKYYSVAELAHLLSVRPATVRRYIRDKTITAVRLPGVNGDFRISETEAKRLVNNAYGSKVMINKMFWVDLETSGLNPQTEIVLEIGCMVTDQWGQELDWFDTLVKYDPKQYNWDISCEPFVKTMHAKSGLFQQVINKKEGAIEHNAWEALDHFVVKHGVDRHPLCGSSVQFDRSFMEWHAPDPLVERFHYRNIDTTSIIETMKIVNLPLFTRLEVDCPGREMHRVRPDLEDSVSRYRWMLENYLAIKESW